MQFWKWIRFFSICVFGVSTTLSASAIEEVREELLSKEPYLYPYSDLSQQLLEKNQTSLLIFSYGSLMDIASASRTLSLKSLETRRPALAYGLKRTFDRAVPIKPYSHWGQPVSLEACGMLNAHRGEWSDMVNGVLVDLTIEDIEGMLAREEGYDLIPVIVQDWHDATQGNKDTYQIAYTFSAAGGQYTSKEIFPRPKYYELTRDAAFQFGEFFGQLWLKTTYFADGTTPIVIWDQWLQQQNPVTQVKSGP